MQRLNRGVLLAALAVPWLFIWQGLDFTDQGYLATGYRCFLRHPEATEDSAHMWLTNLIGATWDALFGGLGLLSLRALWALCMSLGMLLAFRLARSLTSERAAALGTLAASIFLSDRRETWFSYNTCSSLILACAAACVVWGVARREPRLLFSAGGLLGIAPFARFPSLLALALLSTPVFAALLEPERRRALARDLSTMLLGVAAGAGLILLLVRLRGDWALYSHGVRSLFMPTMQKGGYSLHDLMTLFVKDQSRALGWGAFVCAVATGTARVLQRAPVLIGWSVLLLAGAIGIFSLTSMDKTWRWVVPGTTYFVLLGLALGVWRQDRSVRVAAWAVLIVVLVAPLGSDNGIKNAHMGLWLAIPLVIAVLHDLASSWLVGQGQKLAFGAALVLSGEGVHHAYNYTYRDAPRVRLRSSVRHPQLRAQFTTPARAKVVQEVLDALEKRVAPGDLLLAYEGTPLLQYLTKTRPYLNRPWIMGWERGEVTARLVTEAERRSDCLPVVVVTLKGTDSADWPRGNRKLKSHAEQVGTRKVLRAFLRRHGYERQWGNGFFEILEAPGSKRAACR